MPYVFIHTSHIMTLLCLLLFIKANVFYVGRAEAYEAGRITILLENFIARWSTSCWWLSCMLMVPLALL